MSCCYGYVDENSASVIDIEAGLIFVILLHCVEANNASLMDALFVGGPLLRVCS